jgi:hypothetical protein
MKRVMILGAIVTLVSAAAVAQSRSSSQSTIQGVWQVSEVTAASPKPATNTKPEPGLYIFTAKHYSIVRITGDKPRPNLPDAVQKATAAELLAVWNPFAANAGTYEVSGGNLTTRPMVAKNPAAMSTGAFNVSAFKIEGNTLWLTAVRNQSGPVQNPATIKLTRIE